LDGKVALITGAASGIGRSCALRFAEQGALVMVADMNGERAEKVVAEIAAAGGTADSSIVETSSEASCDEMVGATAKRFGRVDVCVAAAGISHAAYVSREVDEQIHSDRMDKSDALLINKSVASWQRLLDVNLTGVMLTDRAVARQMIAQGDGGSIVNITSVAGVTALPGAADYCVSKAGAWMLTKCLAGELARYRIRVNAVGPGFVKTSMSGSSYTRESWVKARLAETPLRRLGEPEDIANACLYLVSDESSFVTGEAIYADGGYGASTRR
jgi:NAD(P)-dependent dehydrogenase (short-subunit alcohol dehydrogenase family)